MVESGRGAAIRQSDAEVRFEWGPVAAAHLTADAECLVVVDVLSFTTSVSICVSRGMAVFPHRWHDASAADFARRTTPSWPCGAGRCRSTIRGRCPPPVLSTAPVTPRLVLPSPNGSTVAGGPPSPTTVTVVAASLRGTRPRSGDGWSSTGTAPPGTPSW